MALFKYIALSTAGERVEGALNGLNEQAVLAELESRQLVPVSIREQAERRGRGTRVSVRKLGMTYTQLADLLRAGVPLLRCLKLLGGRKSAGKLGAVFKDLAEAVSQGEELAAAMGKHETVFPKVHIAMVRAGEKGGFLETVVQRLGQFVIAQADLRGKVNGSLVYPAFLVVFGVIVLIAIFGIFVPMMKPMLASIEDLPALSVFVLGISTAVSEYGLYTLAGLAAVGFIAWRLSKREDVRLWVSTRATWMPVYGPLARSLAAARFCRLLGTMLSNGIPMLAAMQIAKDAAGMPLMAEAIDRAAESVKGGQQLAGPLGESGLFDEEVIEMISVGEAANNLDEVLTTIAVTIEGRVDRMLSAAVRLLEPLLLAVIALGVGIVAAGLILPMTRVNTGF